MYPVAILFFLIGFAIKYGKMYFLIAGYNTMPAKEKAKYDIERIGSLFGNIMFIMAGLIGAAWLVSYWFNYPQAEGYVFFPTIAVGVTWLIIASNSKKYHKNR